MKSKEKKFIIIGVLLAALICGGLYLNHQLNHLAAAITNAELFLALMQEDTALLPEGAPGTPDPGGPLPETAPDDEGAPTALPGTGHNPGPAAADKPAQPPSKKDLLKAGLIILRKFNQEEIDYLYRVGTRGSCTKEELQRVREILLDTLTTQEIDTLREIGAKYGKKLRFLDAEAG